MSKCPGGIVQSILFKKSKWTKIEARKFLKNSGFKSKDIDETKNHFRFRQEDPKKFRAYCTDDKELGQYGVTVIYGYKYAAKR